MPRVGCFCVFMQREKNLRGVATPPPLVIRGLKNAEGSILGKYPYMWLRQICQWSQCLHLSSRGRAVLMAYLNTDVITEKVEIIATDQELNIEWPDKHQSKFALSWLQKNQFSKIPKDSVSEPNLVFLGSEMQNKYRR